MVHQALADYYTAARDRDNARNQLNKLVQLRPDDASLRLRIGEQLLRDGQATEALVHLKAAFKKDPSLLNRLSLLRIQTALVNTGKAEQLLELMEAIDLRPLSAAAREPNHRKPASGSQTQRSRGRALSQSLGGLPSAGWSLYLVRQAR